MLERKKKIINKILIRFFSLHGNGDTICIGQEIQCLLYAGFFGNFRFIFLYRDITAETKR